MVREFESHRFRQRGNMEKDNKKSYEISLRLLGNEVFALKFSSETDSTKWLAIGLTAGALVLGFLVIYGQDVVNMFK